MIQYLPLGWWNQKTGWSSLPGWVRLHWTHGPTTRKTGWNSLWYCPNIGMPAYKYRNPHYKDKMVSQPFYLCNGNSYTRKYGLYMESLHGPHSPTANIPGDVCMWANWAGLKVSKNFHLQVKRKLCKIPLPNCNFTCPGPLDIGICYRWVIIVYGRGMLHVPHQWPLLLTWFNFNPSMDM